MQRAIGRAYQRVKGAHPRRPKSSHRWMVELGCDLLLIAAGLAVLGGFGLAVWGMLGAMQPVKIAVGLGLLALAPVLLLIWERVAWEPFAERLSHLS
ncbi:MAG: hypothetical protein ACXWKM_08535 [Phenylobacterium sp.]